jgi:hypothetical protein
MNKLLKYCGNIDKLLNASLIQKVGLGRTKYVVDGSVLYDSVKAANDLTMSMEDDTEPQVGKELAWAFVTFMRDWHPHSSGEYYYKNDKDFHQWPPDHTATKEELLSKFFPQ